MKQRTRLKSHTHTLNTTICNVYTYLHKYKNVKISLSNLNDSIIVIKVKNINK